MIFDNIHDAKKWFLNYVEFDNSMVNSFYQSEDLGKDWKFGDYILLQHIQDNKISRPIYGIFTSFTIWDQALVLQMVENKRAWMYSNEVRLKIPEATHKGKMPNTNVNICAMDDEITQFEFWTGDINLLGHWKSKPSISELKDALKKQVRDTSYNRDNTLNQLLSDIKPR